MTSIYCIVLDPDPRYPGDFAVRRMRIEGSHTEEEPNFGRADTLEGARALLPPGLDKGDVQGPTSLLEVWL